MASWQRCTENTKLWQGDRVRIGYMSNSPTYAVAYQQGQDVYLRGFSEPVSIINLDVQRD